MKKIFKLPVLFCLFSAIFTASPVFGEQFKNYAFGIDTGYTIFSLFYSGFGGGVWGEAVFGGTFSFAANIGYEALRTEGTNDVRLLYIYGGIRYYTTFDAIAGPFIGLFTGTRFDTINGVNSAYWIIPLEFGWKFIIDYSSGFFLEPIAKFILFPKWDPINGLRNDFAYFAGVNIGLSY